MRLCVAVCTPTFRPHHPDAFKHSHALLLHLQQHLQAVHWCCGCPADGPSQPCSRSDTQVPDQNMHLLQYTHDLDRWARYV
jgi:hypothetical protein